MNWVLQHFDWILYVTGAVTASLGIGLLLPNVVLKMTFGTSLSGSLTLTIVRHWCAQVLLVGALLIYAGMNPQYREIAVAMAGLEKLLLVTFIMTNLHRTWGRAAMLTMVFDGVCVALYAIWWFGR